MITKRSRLLRPEYEAYANDMQVVTWIKSMQDIMPQVLDLNNACDLWQSLRDSYMMQTEAKSMQLKRSLMVMRQGEK